ncbi:hypothetical protein HAX54_028642, partial [Datura stramonium]|nr:hypothetical protein [Datura stramonium]
VSMVNLMVPLNLTLEEMIKAHRDKAARWEEKARLAEEARRAELAASLEDKDRHNPHRQGRNAARNVLFEGEYEQEE